MISAITGKVGSGKNLFAMMRIIEYAFQGRRVVTNFDVDLTSVQPLLHKIIGRPVPEVEVLPGRPTYQEIKQLGKGGIKEHVAGLLVLDEVGPLFNSRSWQDADRKKIIDWLLHSRKLAWDVDLLVQNIGLIDKQIRISVIENMTTCKRLDRLKIAGVIPVPRVHLAIERYGTEANAPISGRTFYRGSRYFECYDTTQILMEEGESRTGVQVCLRPVPQGAKSPNCPKPETPLQQFWYEFSQSEELCRSILPSSS